MKETKKAKWGGPRPNSGRPQNNRKHSITVRLSDEAFDKLQMISNKTKFIDELIKKSL